MDVLSEHWLVVWLTFNVPPNKFIGHNGFNESNDPTDSVKALKEDRVQKIRLQYH